MAWQDKGAIDLSQFAQSKTTKKKKGFWEDQISTGGGLAGALAGGAAGTAIMPGVGTIIGALIGGAVGGGGGQVAENAIVGDNLTDDVFKEAAINGVFGAGPIRGASLLARGGTALARGTGKAGLKAAGEQALIDRPIRNALGKSFGNAGSNMAVRSVGATPSQLTNFQKKFGEDIVPVLSRYNLVGKSADDVLKARKTLDKQFGDLVSEAGAVPKTSLEKALKNAYQPMLKSSSLDKQATGQAVKAQADALLKGIKGKNVPANQLNTIKSEFDSLVNYTQRAADPNKYGVNKTVADVLRETVQGAPGATGLKETGMEISKLRTLEDILQAQGNRGRGSNPVGFTEAIAAGGGGSVAGIPGALVSAGIAKGLNSAPIKRVVAKGLQAGGEKLSAKNTLAQAMGVKPIAMRVGSAGVAGSAFDGQSSDGMNQVMSTNPMENSAASSIPPINSNMNTPYQNQGQMSSEPNIGGVTKPMLQQAMMAALIDGNEDAYSQLAQMNELLDSAFPAADEGKALTQGQQERADLIKALDNTESLMSQGSIDYGPISGRVNDLKAMFNAADPETLSYKNTIQGLRAAITKARAGASLTEGELKMLRQYTPEYTDSEQVVRSKLAELRKLYGYTAPTGGGAVDPSSLESALGY